MAITCKECNSIAGYSVDSARLGEETLNIDLEKDKGSLSIKPIEKVDDPKKPKANREHMAELSRARQWDGQSPVFHVLFFV